MTCENSLKQNGISKVRTNCNGCMMAAGMLLFALFTSVVCRAGEEPGYDAITISLNMPQVGSIEIPAVIRDQELYLSATDVFNFLKIKNSLSPDLNVVTGFIINPDSVFIIDKTRNRIIYSGHIFELDEDDLILEEGSLYLRSDYFGKAFGLECTFNFRSLSAVMYTNRELPVIRELRQKMMRRNLSRLKRELKADTTISLKRPLLHFGMADWSVVTRQLQGRADTRLNLSMGGVVAGGEATVSLNYQSNSPFIASKQYYSWRFVNNDHPFLRQIRIGNIAPQATSTILSPVIGVQITNAPTRYRYSFGTYTLNDYTEPGWIVELYVNNVMVDYTKADASGSFTFEIPLVYGSSLVQLRFYGPWGEERSSVKNIVIPFSLLPPDELEYTVSTGIVTDNLNNRFARANVNYGLSRRMTMGGGVEYLFSLTPAKGMPFLNTTFQLASNMLVSGEYMHGVRSKGVFSYHPLSGIQFQLNYTKYAKGQQAINSRSFEERKAIVSMPLRTPRFVMYSRFTLSQIIAPQGVYSKETKYRDIPKIKYTSTDLMLSTAFGPLSSNLTTYGLFIDKTDPYVYSHLSLAYRLPAKFVFKPQAQFQYNQGRFMMMRLELEKQLSGKGFLNMSYEKNFRTRSSNIMIGLSYNLSFVRTAFSASRNNKTTTLVQSAAGSLVYDKRTKYLNFSNRNKVGSCGAVIQPYLDLNCNGIREKNEPKVSGLSVRSNGGRIVPDPQDTVIRILDLEPYNKYYIELDDTRFENIAWRIKNKTMNVTIGPNQLQLIEVPVAVEGEAAGMVYFMEGQVRKGIGRIIISFYNSKSALVGRTVTEADGFFNYLGFPPGSYTARVDIDQLHNLGLVSSPAILPFTIASDKNGAVEDGLEFTIRSAKGNDLPSYDGP